jgi:Acetyltransferases, including N-acetylases of ribosomal proteins
MLRSALAALVPRRNKAAVLPEDVVLTGERVALRPLQEEDAGALFACASDAEVTRFLPWEPARSVGAVRGFVGDQIRRRREGDSMAFALLLRETGEMIGSIDLMDLKTEPGRAELGYLLRRSHWGRGLMTEGARLALQFGFETLRLRRVVAFADAENWGSRRVLEKAGMTPWGSETRTVKSQKRLYIRYEIRRRDEKRGEDGSAPSAAASTFA